MEELLNLCPERVDDLGGEALEILCRQMPERAGELRSRIEGLKRPGLDAGGQGSALDADTARWLNTLLLLALLRKERRELGEIVQGA